MASERRPRRQRRFPFKGPIQDYVAYLERELESARSQIARLQEAHVVPWAAQDVQTPAMTPPVSNLEIAVVTTDSFKHRINSQVEKPKNPDVEPWKNAASDFLSRIPIDEESWLQKITGTLLSTPDQVLSAFHILTLQQRRVTSSYTDVRSVGLEVVGSYGNLQRFLGTTAAFTTQMYHYSQLLFFCVCLVARENGLGVEEIDQLAAACLPERDGSSVYQMRLRTAAGQVARVIDRLEVKLNHLAPVLFLLCGASMGTYRQFSAWVAMENYLTEQVMKKTVALRRKLPGEVGISFSPAFLITFVGPWTLDQVNRALGTKLGQGEYDERVRIVRETEALVLTTSSRPTKRQRTGHENSGGISAAQTGSPLERGAGAVPHSSREERVTPGADLAGDVSARTAHAPHNSPAVLVDSEFGAGGGQAGPLCHGQGAVAATTGASSDDTQLPSAPNSAVQEPSLMDAISSTTFFQPLNANPQRRDGPTMPSCPTQRPKEGADARGELCHSNAGGALAVSPLHLLADAAAWEHEDPRSVGAVPSPGQHDVATNTSGLVTLLNGSCLPINCLEGQTHATAMEQMRMGMGEQEAPHGIALGITMSPECQNVRATPGSPHRLLSEAAEQAGIPGQAEAGDSLQEDEFFVFMRNVLGQEPPYF